MDQQHGQQVSSSWMPDMCLFSFKQLVLVVRKSEEVKRGLTPQVHLEECRVAECVKTAERRNVLLFHLDFDESEHSYAVRQVSFELSFNRW